jgi:glycosyltransferase involved in cell wall biosynthesis
MSTNAGEGLRVGLLTGGSDKPYAVGLTTALAARGVLVDFIGSDELDTPQVTECPGVDFYNLRGDQSENVPTLKKVLRVLSYYRRLMVYVATGRPRILHILWNSRFEWIDRTVLMVFYHLLGKRVVLTAHNVNAAKRDSRDTWMNRASLRFQYRLCHQVFVHTARMKRELIEEFGVAEHRVTVIPFGINDTIPSTDLTVAAARRGLGLPAGLPTVLFFGQIAPYKGLKDLVQALALLAESGRDVHLMIVGKVKRGWEAYWDETRQAIEACRLGPHVTARIGFIPDAEVEQYFKAADALVVPYRDIFQSGVPFLAYSFGCPVIATDVGSFREVIVEGRTGFLCAPNDPVALGQAIDAYFRSALYTDLDARREDIRSVAVGRHSWETVGEITSRVYAELLSEHSHAPESSVARP